MEEVRERETRLDSWLWRKSEKERQGWIVGYGGSQRKRDNAG